jgi:hypothetical protein
VGVPAKVRTRPARSFWWDREPLAEADVLRAVIFDADSALTDDGCDASKIGLIDSVMSLFCSGVWVGIVSTRRREWAHTLVRHVIGDGLVETIVTVDDLGDVNAGHARDAELYRLALWELGITAQDALAVVGSGRGLRATLAADLPAVVLTAGDDVDERVAGAAEVRVGYAGPHPLSAADYQRTHRLWSIAQQRFRAA